MARASTRPTTPALTEPIPQPARHPNQTPPARTQQRQARVLRLIAETGRIKQSCHALGVGTGLLYQWAMRNDAFAKKLDVAREAGERVLLSEYEDKIDAEATTAPFDKVTGVLTMFRVKRLDPRYRENAQVQMIATGPVAISMGVEAAPDPGPSTDRTPQDVVPEG